MTLSDGQHAICGKENLAHINVELPRQLKKITVTFQNDEKKISRISFQGETNLDISMASQTSVWDQGQDYRGRSKTFVFQPNEDLLGAIFHGTTSRTYGITWIKWRRPQA